MLVPLDQPARTRRHPLAGRGVRAVRQDRPRMKILLWHGYLLGGTGSNVYTRMLARAWSRAGHEVVVFCQEPHPGEFDLGGATVVRPELPGPLPVFVLDRYEDLEARYLQDFTCEERDAFVEANAAAVREHLPADYCSSNHVLLGAPVGVASRRAVLGQGARLRARVLDPRQRRARRVGAREPRPGRGRLRGLRAHPPRARGGRRAGRVRRARARSSRPASTSRSCARSRARRRCAALVAEARRDPPNPGRARERLPDPGERRAARRVPRGRGARRSSTSGS